MKRLINVLVLILLASIAVSAECGNPGEKRDTGSADDFVKHRGRVEKWRKRASLPPTPTPMPVWDALQISGHQNNNDLIMPPDEDLAVRDGMGFSEGLGAVVVNGKFGFIDARGSVVIKPGFTTANCFSEGLSAVEIDGKWGFIDKLGAVVIPIEFDFVLDFSEGLALAKVGNLWGYIDRSGKFAIPPKYEDARSFAEGFAHVRFYDPDHRWTSNIERKGRWRSAFIDKTGNLALGPFDGAYGDFTGGMALVERTVGYRNGILVEGYFVDKTGKELWLLNSHYVTRFRNDAIRVAAGDDPVTGRTRYSFLDRGGKRLFERTFSDACDFSEGLAVAREGDNFGFINKKGEYVIPPVFSGAETFSEGMAAVWKNGKIGFLDKTGQWQIGSRFDWTGYFREGKAAVAINDKFGYIDKTGKYIWKPTR